MYQVYRISNTHTQCVTILQLRTLEDVTGSLCSYSRYFSTFVNVLKKDGVSLHAFRSPRVIRSAGSEKEEGEGKGREVAKRLEVVLHRTD